MRQLAILVSLVAAFSLPLRLQAAAQADAIDRYVSTQLQRQHIPGLALAVVRDGRIVKLSGYGFADLERKVPATPDSVFEIGSITKQFTSMAVMRLVEEGKLRLDDPTGEYLTNIPDEWRAVTLRQLLTHTSGVPDFEAIIGYGAYRNVWKPEAVIAACAARPMDFPPGSKWSYSNTGYFLLSLILQKVDGERYEELIRQRVLEPAGMTHTRSSEPMDIIPNRAAGYLFNNGHLENRDALQPSIGSGAGMLVSTVGDLVKWDAALAAHAIISPASYETIWTDQPLADGSLSGYGFGWFVAPMHGRRSQNHSGGTAGFSANILRLPDDGVTVIVLANSGNANSIAIANHIARELVPGLVYTAIPDQQPELARRVLDFYAHRSDPGVYKKPLSTAFAEKILPFWSANLSDYRELGAPLAIELVERADAHHSRYRIRYADVSRIASISFDADLKIDDAMGEEE